MSDKKISQLATSTTLIGTELVPIVQGGQTVATTPNAISALIKPYKVYTALLMQSGSDVGAQYTSSAPLTIGVTYTIDSYVAGDDFSNVGGPGVSNINNYWNDYKFIATGTTPKNWVGETSIYFIPAAPVVTVLENTIGNIWFTYNSIGAYFVNSDALFTNNKIVTFLQNTVDDANNASTNLGYAIDYPNSFQIITASNTGTSWVDSDSLLYNTPIEIRVYS